MTGIGGDLFAIVYDAKNEDAARAERERALRVRGDTRGVRIAEA